jgi:hypothetical protein
MRSRKRNQHLALSGAILPILFAFGLEGGGGGGGGSAAADEAAKKKAEEEAAAKKKAEEEAARQKPVTLTQADLDKRVGDAVDAGIKRYQEAKDREAAEAAGKEKREKEAEARQKAKEAGDHQRLYESEAQRNKELEQQAAEKDIELRKTRAEIALRDYLAEKHQAYSGSAKYILATITIGPKMTEADVKTAVEAAAEAFVKDNPRGQQKQGGGAPPAPNRGKMDGGSGNPPPADKTPPTAGTQWTSRRF